MNKIIKLNEKRGVTIALLVATVVIIIVLVSAVTVSFKSIKESTLKKEFGNEVYSLQKLAEKYIFENNVYPIKGDFNLNLNNIDPQSKSQFSTEPNYTSDTIMLGELDLFEVGASEVNRGTNKQSNDKYLISKDTGKVYYLKGEKIGSTVYYTITDEIKKELGI